MISEQGTRLEKLRLALLQIADAACFAAIGVAAFVVRHGDLDMNVFQTSALAIIPVLGSYSLNLAGLHIPDRDRDPLAEARAITLALAGSFALFTLLAFATKFVHEISRLWLAYWAAGNVAAAIGLRRALQRLGRLRPRPRGGPGMVVVGREPMLGRLIARIRQDRQFRDLDIRTIPLPLPAGTKLVSAIQATAPRSGVAGILLAVPPDDVATIQDAVRAALPYSASVDLCTALSFEDIPVTCRKGPAGLQLLRVGGGPAVSGMHVLKNMQDWLIAALLLVPALPVMAVIALAVRIDSPGPVLFRQVRYGFNNRPFTVYKFRTMRHRATGDGRPPVTRVGAVLRQCGLDELPQLFNVLNGTMALIGPRPHVAVQHEFYATALDAYLLRHRVRPGITGWAQVSGWHGDVPDLQHMRQRLDHDMYYVENWSPLFDLVILWRTVRFFFGQVARMAKT